MRTPALLLFAATAFAADTSFVFEKDVPTQTDLAHKPIPKWRDGTMVLLDPHRGSQIGIFLQTGERNSRVTFAIPGAREITVRGFNRGADGTIVLCGGLTDAQGRSSSYVGWISPQEQTSHVIPTSPFVPMHVALAADGSIWAQGGEIKGNGEVFRQFSKSGALLRAIVPQSEITKPDALLQNTNVFQAVGDNIVWYSGGQYISIASADGSVVKINGLPLPNDEPLSGGAIGPQGELFASSAGASTWSVSQLDLDGKRWIPIASGSMHDRTTPVYRPTLLGSDGDHLVVLGKDGRHVKFFRVTNP